MWHWSSDEINLMKRRIREGYRWASRGESERILTLHRNPIEILFMGEWCSAGSEQDYQEMQGDFLPHLLPGQYVDMKKAISFDICSSCGKGRVIFSPVLVHQSYCKQNKSMFTRHWECPVCGANGDALYVGRLERITEE